ncbi:MAG: helicase C-terminal domain-containing protein [Phycisphaerales bacterium]
MRKGDPFNGACASYTPGVVNPSEALSETGPIAAMLGEGYEPRPEQIEMTGAVSRAMAQGERLLAEAGTGVGKSYAYLLPAIERCVAHGETVVVATNTIALQEQIVRKDLPMLMKALGLGELPGTLEEHDPMAPLRPAIVVGRGNYLSLRRLELASRRQDKLFVDASARGSLHIIEDWARDTKDGSRSSLPQLERPGVWDSVRSDSGNCMGRRCPNHDICFYQRSRRKMERSNLLICNHALFFSDLALRSRGVGFLPHYDHVILDEAHMVEDVASEHFGVSLAEGRVNHLLSLLFVEKGLKGFLPQLAVKSDETQHVQKAIAAVQEARDASGAFFESLIFWYDEHRGAGGRVREAAIVDNVLSPIMSQLATRLRLLRELCEHEADKFELQSYAERASDIADCAHIVVEQTLEGCAYWVEVSRSLGYRKPSVKIQCSPIEVAPILKTELFNRDPEDEGSALPKSVVLTSATLTTRGVSEEEPDERKETAFAHAMDRLGCDGARVMQLGSPFDHASQAELVVDVTMPLPQNFGQGRLSQSGATYHEELARRVLTHIEDTDGGAFVLFTSFTSLYAVADELKLDLEEQGIPMYVQGRGPSRSEMLSAFKEDPRSVLLGAASFWQGVDVQGAGLRNVIITRLPFDPPGRPLTEARLERIKELGRDPFREESIPRAVIRFKQGFGRLIRSKADSGRVAVLDPRIVTARYGQFFLAALPEGIRVRRIDGSKPLHGGGEQEQQRQRPEHQQFDADDLPF